METEMYDGDQIVSIATNPYDLGIYLQTTEVFESNGKEQLQSMATTTSIPYPFRDMAVLAEGGPSNKTYHEQEMKKESMVAKEEEAKLEMIRREKENKRINLLLMGEKETPLWSLEDERNYQREKKDMEERQRKGKGVQENYAQSQEEAIITKEAGTSRFSPSTLNSLLNHQLSVYVKDSQGQTIHPISQNHVDSEGEYGDIGDNFGPLDHNSIIAYQMEVEDIINETKHIFVVRENEKEAQVDESDRAVQSKDQNEQGPQQKSRTINTRKGKSRLMSSEESSNSPSESESSTSSSQAIVES